MSLLSTGTSLHHHLSTHNLSLDTLPRVTQSRNKNTHLMNTTAPHLFSTFNSSSTWSLYPKQKKQPTHLSDYYQHQTSERRAPEIKIGSLFPRSIRKRDLLESSEHQYRMKSSSSCRSRDSSHHQRAVVVVRTTLTKYRSAKCLFS